MKNPEQPQAPSGSGAPFSRASVARFSLYLRFVQRLAEQGCRTVSSIQLGQALGITDAQVRKDLSSLGNLGHRGVGYHIDELIAALKPVLGIDRTWAVVLVGVGNLARALLRFKGFEHQGFHIVAAFDVDPEKVGQRIDGIAVYSMDRMAEMIEETNAQLAILTVPAGVAQEVADQAVAGGIRGILNFAPTALRLPPTVHLNSVDLAIQMEQLASLVRHDMRD